MISFSTIICRSSITDCHMRNIFCGQFNKISDNGAICLTFDSISDSMLQKSCPLIKFVDSLRIVAVALIVLSAS